MINSAAIARPRAGDFNFVLVCVFIDMLGIGLIVPVLPLLVGEFDGGRETSRRCGSASCRPCSA
jgi:DHA1 family tetracycline resistance protein-like MFS transporter